MSRVSVVIPVPLRAFTGGAAALEVEGGSVGEALAAVERRHPGFRARVLTPEGRLRPYVNVFVGADRVQDLEGLATPLAEGDTVHIIPAVAGGGAEAQDASSRR